ncbi:hypothetical protein O181_031614 [Austropuccinia psidii MF-1]|uniref:C2H2-type domain-containing protein n=1 Tax=Austropuccinia psidii MF-1 TaxID=1389203 RepID=A0A9Q3CW17_9BASI|nr:hypothetical protein [Austropuccinia psidii MF-1]
MKFLVGLASNRLKLTIITLNQYIKLMIITTPSTPISTLISSPISTLAAKPAKSTLYTTLTQRTSSVQRSSTPWLSCPRLLRLSLSSGICSRLAPACLLSITAAVPPLLAIIALTAIRNSLTLRQLYLFKTHILAFFVVLFIVDSPLDHYQLTLLRSKTSQFFVMISEFGVPGEPRPRSPSPGRGGRFDDGGRRSPAPSDRWNGSVDRSSAGPTAATHRGRSPADFARKRRRDESPPSRDRYIPNYEREPYRERERRDHHPHSTHDHGLNPRHGPGGDIFNDPYRRGDNAYRDEPFGYSPERGLPGRGGPNNYSRSHLTPPSELPHLVSFRYFADFMRATSPHIAEDKEKLAEQWKRYRHDYTRKHLVTFFEENKSKHWFREKYLPGAEFEEMRERLKKKGREGKVEKFIQGLEKGDFDIVNYDYLPMSKKFTNSKSNIENVDQGGNDLKNENASNAPPLIPDPHLVEEGHTKPSVLPPKPEDPEALPLSEVKITLTDPQSNIKNENNLPHLDAEGDEFEDADDEFSNSMAEALSGPNPALAPSSILGSLIGESMRGKTGSDDIVIVPPFENQLFIKSISPDISRLELENHCKQAEGFDYLALSDPHTAKKLHRVGWVSFLPGTDMQVAESILSESKLNNFTLHMMRAERPAFQKLRVCPGIMNTHDRILKDLSYIRKLAVQFENEYFGLGVDEDKRGSTAIEAKIKHMKEELVENIGSTSLGSDAKLDKVDSETPQNLELSDLDGESKALVPDEKMYFIDKKALDIYLYYLRTAFHCCYYCVCVCDFQEELLRRCAKHVRKPAPASTDDATIITTPKSHRKNAHSQSTRANENSWARTLDERLSLLLARSEVDPRDFGGERIDDEIHRLCQPQITDEGAGKFRCKNCSKLFKAMNFIEKHIMTKHTEVINQDSIERIKYLNNYVLDPSHTTPQPPQAPDHTHGRANNGMSSVMSSSHTMMPNLGSMGGASDFHNNRSYPPMVNNPMTGPGGMVMGGPYTGYPPPMYASYHGHPYSPMTGPPSMFANGPMMGGHHPTGPAPPGGYGAPYYMNAMGPAAGYPPPFQPHHQVYASLPPIPSMAQGRMQNGNSRRLGDRISRNFADDNFLPLPPHDPKRARREEHARMNGRITANNGIAPMDLVSSDPRSKTVLAYNDLDTPAGDEIVLNY